MSKLKITPLSPTGEQPVDFYSWGDQSTSGIISRRRQNEEAIEEAFDSIEIKEDKETPETDYVLKVLGKEAGRVVIPFDMVVKDAYYDKDTKEVVIIVRISETEEKEIRFSVADLIQTYEGDETTVHIENNVISITNEVMNKFDDYLKKENSIPLNDIKALFETNTEETDNQIEDSEEVTHIYSIANIATEAKEDEVETSLWNKFKNMF